MTSYDPTMTPPPLHGYRGVNHGEPILQPHGMTIAITREAGARGGSIARKVARILGWQLFNQDMLDYLNRDPGAKSELLSELPPGASGWADQQLTRLSQDYRIALESETANVMRLMLTVAARGEAVLVGRGAGFILPAESTVHVRIVSPLDERIAYMGQWLRLTRDEATEEVKARDGRRAAFLSHLFPQDSADVYRYDLILNSSRLGEEACAEIITRAVKAKLPHADDADPFLPDADEIL
jgi:cytidylate kinase